MMADWKKYIISDTATVRQALQQLDSLGAVGAVLFVTEGENRLLGSITDGDIRRSILKGLDLYGGISGVMHSPCQFLRTLTPSEKELETLRKNHIRFVPVIDGKGLIIRILDLEGVAQLPLDVILMAGGEGKRLLPLTEGIPKPLLKIGSKPILEHNIDRLARYGIADIHLSIRYLGDKIREYFGDGESRQLRIHYTEESKPMGTIGSVSLIKDLRHPHVLIMNADLLTNIDFADFYAAFLQSDADMCMASTLYSVEVPYAILQTGQDNRVLGLAEKPSYTYYSNAGIYLVKKSLLDLVPENSHFDITDLMAKALQDGRTIFHYPILGYWLDIGKIQDYQKAQQDIKHLKL